MSQGSSQDTSYRQSQQKLLALEARVDALIREHQRLQRMVTAHEEERQNWKRERLDLHQRNQEARERLDYVIARLKEFEQA